ncbi:MAG: zinc ribbon domain-containing protein [Candidatus Riflebacteria bacterium]|nr:zinc ribbon domain-containing protein [Candidatus Riflebacteria bacterium]
MNKKARVCPKCEKAITDGGTICHSCGYRLQIKCSVCGSSNIPQAVFCGECGQALSFSRRIKYKLEEGIYWLLGEKARHIIAGFVFGVLLIMFAFGAMGMKSPEHAKVQPENQISQPILSVMVSESGKKALGSLSKAFEKENSSREISRKDLIRVGNLILEAFSPSLNQNKEIFNPDFSDSRKYLQSLELSRAENAGEKLTRADIAVFLFRLISDVFDVSNCEVSENKYNDIPKYHFMNIPVETLDSLGIHISRENGVFGGEDTVSIKWLSKLSVDVIRTCENRLKTRNSTVSELQN